MIVSEMAFKIADVIRKLEFVPKDEDFLEDESNSFVDFNQDEQLVLGRRFFTLANDVQDKSLPIVGFVGPTGVGKSGLVRMLCTKEPYPLPGDPTATISTSSNIHAYLRDSTSNGTHLLLLDCEGVNGTTNTASKRLQAKHKMEGLLRRHKVVARAYPRLIYLFSDILCFVFRGSIRESGSILKLLYDFADISAAGSVNRPRRPVLILIFNYVGMNSADWTKGLREASDQWKRDHDELNTLEKFFSEIWTLNVPNAGESQYQFYCQVQQLRELIQKKQSEVHALKRSDVFLSINRAVQVLNADPEAPIDFLKLALAHQPFPVNFADNIMAFFEGLIGASKEEDPVKKFAECVALVKDAIQHALQIHLLRSNQRIILPANEGTSPALLEFAETAKKRISTRLPCKSWITFTNADGASITARCEQIQENHQDGFHRSSQRYTILSERRVLFWSTEQVTFATCAWRGEYEPTHFADWSIRVSGQLSEADLTRERVLWLRNCRALVDHKNYRVCVGCLLESPLQRLQCKHMFCGPCCKEFTESNVNRITCPLCGEESEFTSQTEIPSHAGYRVLSLDGGGVRAVGILATLSRIQKRLGGVPIIEMFDYVIGTSAGSIVALALTKGMSVEDAMKVTSTIAEKAFSSNILLSLPYRLYNRVWYSGKNLQLQLETHLGKEQLFGIRAHPKIAVVACTRESGGYESAIFTSYVRRDSSKSIPYVEATLAEAAQASSSAGTFFPAFQTKYGLFTDGGMRHNNPCMIGYEEAHSLWGGKHSCDLVLSVGTGHWENAEAQLRNDYSTALIGDIVKELTNATHAFTQLSKIDGLRQKCMRLDFQLSKDYQLWDAKRMKEIREEAEGISGIPDDEIEEACHRILASNYFLTPETNGLMFSPIHDRKFLGRIQVRNKRLKMEVGDVGFFFRIHYAGGQENSKVYNDAMKQTCSKTLAVELLNLPINRPLQIHASMMIGAAVGKSYEISGSPFVLH